jgi:hypothetical protein
MVKGQVGTMELKESSRAWCRTLHAGTLFLIMIVAVSTSYPVFSSLTQNIVIQSTAMIGSPGMIAPSGSPADIQATVNAVNNAGGGTVYVPAGTFHWNGQTVTIPGGVNVIGASYAGCMSHGDNWQSYTATTILHDDYVVTTPRDWAMFYVNGYNNPKQTRISGIQFEHTPPLTAATEWMVDKIYAIDLLQAKNFRIDHCTFINFIGMAIENEATSPSTGSSSYGLVDHCVLDWPYKLVPEPTGTGWQAGYGLDCLGNMAESYGNWIDDVSLYAGKYGAISDVALMIAEDCHISRSRHAIDASAGGVIVPRFCLFDHPAPYMLQTTNNGEISSHGGWGNVQATELLEAYNNTITGSTADTDLSTVACRIRGGHGIFYNNHFNPIYPVNAGWEQRFMLMELDNPLHPITQTYIWNNDYSNCLFLDNRNPSQIVENVNYFLRAPTQAQDGWTYTPYPYPHPLVGG